MRRGGCRRRELPLRWLIVNRGRASDGTKRSPLWKRKQALRNYSWHVFIANVHPKAGPGRYARSQGGAGAGSNLFGPIDCPALRLLRIVLCDAIIPNATSTLLVSVPNLSGAFCRMPCFCGRPNGHNGCRLSPQLTRRSRPCVCDRLHATSMLWLRQKSLPQPPATREYRARRDVRRHRGEIGAASASCCTRRYRVGRVKACRRR